MKEPPICGALKSQILRKGAGNPSKILPPNSLSAQFVPTVQNFASDLNKTRNQLSLSSLFALSIIPAIPMLWPALPVRSQVNGDLRFVQYFELKLVRNIKSPAHTHNSALSS